MPVRFMRGALNEGVRPREVLAWALYDFANSGYTTVVLTAVFNAYFVSVVARNAEWGTLAWTAALSLSYLIVMLAMPGLGAWADARAGKKRLLAASTIGCVAATAALALAGPGSLWIAVAAIVVSNVCYSIGESVIAAFLPELARPQALGRVSGWGWSFGYVGGMLTLGLSLAIVLAAQAAGRPATDFVPWTMLVTAAVFAAAAVPVFMFLRERAQPQDAVRAVPGPGAVLRQLAASWRGARAFPDFRMLLVCGVFYQAGIAVVITLAAVYAEQVMQFAQAQIMMLVFLVNIAAAAGAFSFGFVEDRIGHKPALAVTLAGWIAMVLVAFFATSPAGFWVAATIAGLCMGSSQSAGRAMTGALAPVARLGEFFALWTFATRLASIIGPLTYGIVTWATAGNHRLGILSTGVFFVIGLAVLGRVDMARGVARGRAAGAVSPSGS
ncbi:Vacuole effluxer Atg22 like protein [Pigmentiphaga humi]|uniref:Vacuole effluxer Atg22 like protein n=1 Tax=Pigmentiphaga humi TaxID=2478468 RepID=A0A3P4B577_9BURK|nr:MFS transporter [Pigmentiphaga humi]VCU71437.1 Vacuole effluxer Atg22 like protein [Pigmentiphaga humi]